MNDPLLSFVILTWNSEATISQTIDSLQRILSSNKHENYEIVIVDNGSKDRTLLILEALKADPRISLHRLEKNQGTTISRNIALHQLKGRYVCILDSDIIIKKWAVKESLAFLNSHPCLLAPKLILPNGVIQPSVKLFPTLTAKLLKLLKIILKINRFDHLDFYNNFPFSSVEKVDTAISAFWIFPYEFLDKVGYFDENIFYSPEDVDYCLRVWKKGFPIYYYPLIEAVHVTQQISHKKPFSKISLSHFKDLLYYFVKHHYFFSKPVFKTAPEPPLNRNPNGLGDNHSKAKNENKA